MKTLVKICGITRHEDALQAAAAGASFLGYIFYAPSKRFIAPRSAKDIVQRVREEFPQVQHVGVFVDDEVTNMAWVRNLVGLDLLQLHGNESVDVCSELSSLGIDVIKALGIGANESEPVDFRQFNVSYFLCDTYDANLKGGTGRQFDLSKLPTGLPTSRMFIAGGLNPANVAELVRERQPFAVDVSTGVEIRPGVKAHGLVTDFISSVLSANRDANKEKVENV